MQKWKWSVAFSFSVILVLTKLLNKMNTEIFPFCTLPCIFFKTIYFFIWERERPVWWGVEEEEKEEEKEQRERDKLSPCWVQSPSLAIPWPWGHYPSQNQEPKPQPTEPTGCPAFLKIWYIFSFRSCQQHFFHCGKGGSSLTIVKFFLIFGMVMYLFSQKIHFRFLFILLKICFPDLKVYFHYWANQSTNFFCGCFFIYHLFGVFFFFSIRLPG